MTVAGNQGQDIYPAPDNYPASSFPQPVPAPDVEANDPDTLMLVQYSWEWQPVLLAALTQLKNPATWQGSHDEIILAINRATDLQDLLQIPVVASDVVETPYWDESRPTTTDDTASPSEQTWFGHVSGGDFVEDLGVWVVSAFLAATVSPQAALLYSTYERRFRLAFLSDGLPGFAKVVIDEVVHGRIDLSGDAGDLIERDFATEGDAPHSVMIVYEDT